MKVVLFVVASVVSSVAAANNFDELRKPNELSESEKQCENIVVSKPHPNYPLLAAKGNISGWAELGFDVSEDGKAVNIKAVDSEPSDTFVLESIRMLKKWKFKDDAPTNGCKVVVQYKLQK